MKKNFHVLVREISSKNLFNATCSYFWFHIPEMSVVLPKDHTASSASPLPCVMKASVSTTLGRSLIYIAQRKQFFGRPTLIMDSTTNHSVFTAKHNQRFLFWPKNKLLNLRITACSKPKRRQRASPAASPGAPSPLQRELSAGSAGCG